MLFAYLDESFDDDRYWVAALVTRAAYVKQLAERLDAVTAWAAESWGTDPQAELHGYSILHGCDDWDGVGLRARMAVYREAMKVIGESPLWLIIRGVNVPRLNARYRRPEHPHAVALRHTIERVDELSSGLRDHVLLVADEIDGQDGHQNALWRYTTVSTGGYRARQITQVVDTIHFVPSCESRPVQAVDLVAYLYRRMKSGCVTDTRARAFNTTLWSLVAQRVKHQWCWHP